MFGRAAAWKIFFIAVISLIFLLSPEVKLQELKSHVWILFRLTAVHLFYNSLVQCAFTFGFLFITEIENEESIVPRECVKNFQVV